MAIDDRISAAVINYQTPDLLDTAVRSFHSHYPDVTVLVIDNGSSDESPAMIEALGAELGNVIETRVLNENRYHGPAMDLALRELQTDYVYIFDSDTATLRSGFLEQMMRLADRDGVYGVGQIVHVNKRGFAVREGIPVLVSAHMLINRNLYLTLPPFIHHGLPALANFKAASDRGLRLESYPVAEYVKHFGRGTAERFGYGLGLRSRLDYLLNKIGL
jgi:glycosyltransferase involved in cell wall biosynthesis